MAAPGGPQHRQGAATIGGLHTDVVYTEYDNCIFLLLTQYKKIGTMVEAKRDTALDETTGAVTYSTKVLLGKDEPMMHVLARSLAAKIGGSKTILFGFAFKSTEAPILRAAEDLAISHVKLKS